MINKRDSKQDQAWQEWLSDGVVPSVSKPRPNVPKETFEMNLQRQPAEKIANVPMAKKPMPPLGRSQHTARSIRPAPVQRPSRSSSFDRSRRVSGVEGIRSQKIDNSSSATNKKSDSQPAIAIHITLPKLNLSKLQLPKYIFSRTQRYSLVGATLVCMLLIGGWWLVRNSITAPKQPGAPKTTAAVATDMGFVPFAPEGRGMIVPGQANPYYNTSKKFYQYNETYREASITINEQPFPEKLKKKTELEKLYKSIGANESFTTTLGKVHVSTDQTSGAQRLVLTNSYMLMFIQSTKSLSNEDWAQYIESFERIQ